MSDDTFQSLPTLSLPSFPPFRLLLDLGQKFFCSHMRSVVPKTSRTTGRKLSASAVRRGVCSISYRWKLVLCSGSIPDVTENTKSSVSLTVQTLADSRGAGYGEVGEMFTFASLHICYLKRAVLKRKAYLWLTAARTNKKCIFVK